MLKRDVRRFSAIMIIVGCLFCLLGIWRQNLLLSYIAAGIGACMVLLQFFPRVLTRVYAGWVTFSRGLAWVNSRILLIMIFYVIITPIGFIMRLFGKRPIDIAVNDNQQSAWKDCEPHRKDHWLQMY